jgi:hypothetical protein
VYDLKTHFLPHSKYSPPSTNNQHLALICTAPLFYILATTCFGSSLPSSRRFLDPSELLGIQIEWMVYFKYLRRILEAPWWWQATAETCSSQYIE